jgi:hypothetical protein
MRGRSGILLSIAIFAAFVLLAAALGKRQRGVVDVDERASSFVSGPRGTSGLFEALERLGVQASRFRGRPRDLANDSTAARRGRGRGRTAFLILGPTRAITAAEAPAILEYNARASGGADLILAAAGFMGTAMPRCFGYRVHSLAPDSVRVELPRELSGRPFYTRATLAPVEYGDTPPPFGALCSALVIRRVDTVLSTTRGPAVLRLQHADAGRDVILVADAALFRNRQLKETRAGPFVLALLAQRYDRVVFDEFHHGYGPSGSLARALGSWSLRSPVGWGVWQAIVVGVLALVAAAVRFGPPRVLGERKRRASLEHVRALATALASARGHDTAISVLIRGLRRRLSVLGRQDDKAWLDSLSTDRLPAPARAAVAELRNLTTPGQDAAAVLRAANAVEDVWDTLRHSARTNWRR